VGKERDDLLLAGGKIAEIHGTVIGKSDINAVVFIIIYNLLSI